MSTPHPSRARLVVLWVLQVALAFAFGMAGAMKIAQPPEALGMAWALAVPPGLVRFIGVAEVAGAVGLILPALFRVLPILTPLAAFGLMVVMVMAAGFHAMRDEFDMIPVNLVLGVLAFAVAWGRLRLVRRGA